MNEIQGKLFVEPLGKGNMFKVRAITEDQQELTFECSPSEDIISAGLKRDVILLSSCREGGCATCKADVLEGDYELGGCSVQALPPDEEESGVALLCRTFPRSDLVIQLPYTFDRISFQKVNTDWQGEIVAVERVSSNVAKLRIEPRDALTGAPIKKFLLCRVSISISKSRVPASADPIRWRRPATNRNSIF